MKRFTGWVRVLFWISAVLLVWMAMAYLLMLTLSTRPAPGSTPSLGDFASVLFGASSFATIIISLIVGAGALIQWQSLKAEVRKVIKAAEAARDESARSTKENSRRVDELERGMRGRLHAIVGLAVGTVHSEDKSYLAEAIHWCQKGYEDLKEVEGNGKYMALNNVVYFSCLLGVESRRERDRLLQQARDIRAIAEGYPDSVWHYPYLLTFCRAVSTYGAEPKELQEAVAIAEDIRNQKLTSLQTTEATHLVASLQAKLAASSPPRTRPSQATGD